MKLNTLKLSALAALLLAGFMAPLSAMAAPCKLGETEIEESRWGILVSDCYIQDSKKSS